MVHVDVDVFLLYMVVVLLLLSLLWLSLMLVVFSSQRCLSCHAVCRVVVVVLGGVFDDVCSCCSCWCCSCHASSFLVGVLDYFFVLVFLRLFFTLFLVRHVRARVVVHALFVWVGLCFWAALVVVVVVVFLLLLVDVPLVVVDDSLLLLFLLLLLL